MNHSVRRAIATVAVLAGCAACARPAIQAPGGPWLPDAGALTAVAEATSACAGARTLSAEVAVAGRAGGQRLRGRLLAGFERPGRARLEGLAPFGAPLFILAARNNRAVLLLPREQRVVSGEAVDDVLAALTGLERDADDLLALMTGCVSASRELAAGAANPSGWITADVAPGLSVFARREEGVWRLRRAHQRDAAGTATAWMVEYGEFVSGFPARIRLLEPASAGGGGGTDLTLRVTQREVNVDIPGAAFALDVPAGYAGMTLDELRGRGPLAETAGPGRRP